MKTSEIIKLVCSELGITKADLAKRMGVLPSSFYRKLARESMTDFFHTFARYLSPMEQQILPLFLEGMSYRDIAEHCGRNVKSVDNAVQRIRRKLARQINPGDFSES